MTASMVFINLPVRDLPRSRAFFEALGFEVELRYTGDENACIVLGPTIFAMLHAPGSLTRFDPRPLADATATATAIYALGVDDRAEVDAIADRAIPAGGSAAREPEDMGFMYLRSFHDPDGYLWEVAWMDQSAGEAGVASEG